MASRRWQDLSKLEQKQIQQQLAGLPDPDQQREQRNGNGKGFRLKGYVRCDLTVSERTAFQEWEALHELGTSAGRLVGLVEDGYLLKVSPNGTGFQASLCASDTGKPWDGYVLVAMAKYAARAVHVLVYKHDVLLDGNWSTAMEEDNEDFMR